MGLGDVLKCKYTYFVKETPTTPKAAFETLEKSFRGDAITLDQTHSLKRVDGNFGDRTIKMYEEALMRPGLLVTLSPWRFEKVTHLMGEPDYYFKKTSSDGTEANADALAQQSDNPWVIELIAKMFGAEGRVSEQAECKVFDISWTTTLFPKKPVQLTPELFAMRITNR